jgi:hypothetical protein
MMAGLQIIASDPELDITAIDIFFRERRCGRKGGSTGITDTIPTSRYRNGRMARHGYG